MIKVLPAFMNVFVLKNIVLYFISGPTPLFDFASILKCRFFHVRYTYFGNCKVPKICLYRVW